MNAFILIIIATSYSSTSMQEFYSREKCESAIEKIRVEAPYHKMMCVAK